MTTAEKRAELEIAGEPWPDCDCHGEPKAWNRKGSSGWFECRMRRRDQQRLRRQQLRAAGVCVHCGAELDTETMCATCAARHRDTSWKHEQQPRRRLTKYLDNTARRNRTRVTEEFHPTGVGQALIASHLADRMGPPQESSRDE